MTTQPTFLVDKKGLAKILARRDKSLSRKFADSVALLGARLAKHIQHHGMP